MKKNKKWILVLLIAFPSFFWLILETSTINSRKLPHYGPKKVMAVGDTAFYKVGDRFLKLGTDSTLVEHELREFPLYVLMFVRGSYKDDAYRIAGLWEYLKYKKDKIRHIPLVLISEPNSASSTVQTDLQKLAESENVHFYTWHQTSFDSINRSYFLEKPYYIDYSFLVLVDANRNIRGYYDARFVSEVKRLIGEYQHLRLKEEKQLLIDENEITKTN